MMRGLAGSSSSTKMLISNAILWSVGRSVGRLSSSSSDYVHDWRGETPNVHLAMWIKLSIDVSNVFLSLSLETPDLVMNF